MHYHYGKHKIHRIHHVYEYKNECFIRPTFHWSERHIPCWCNMRIMISPAKKMRVDTDTFAWNGLPVFLERTEVLRDWIKGLSYAEQKKLWACNDKIAQENAARFADMDLRSNLTPAILAYDGIQYTSMGPSVFESSQMDYVQQHLCILSGFYGVLKPLDGVAPYRLEMQAKAAVNGHANLYDFWGDALYREILDDSRIIVNLASQEYAKCVEKYLTPEDRFVTCVFGEIEHGKVVQKSVYAKMTRGDMVRYLAEIQADALEQIKGFNISGYHFDAERSTDTEYVFIRTKITGKQRKSDA